MRTAAVFAILAGLARAACVAVPSSNILARDLATAVPSFQALDPDEIIGFAPFPGTVRVLSSHDVVLTGRRYGLAFPPGETAPSVCVERIVHHLALEEVRASLLAAFDNADVRLEVLAFSNQPFPPGRLEFQRATLNKPPGNNPQTPVIWRGRLLYDDQRSLVVWAKVRISVDGDIFLATESIPKGAVIRADQVATAHVRQFPSSELSPTLPLAVVGKIARRILPAGQPIVADALDDFKDVFRGETVHVQAIDGGASIRFDAIAQSSGQKGEVIMVHNPSSGRNFRALIEGPEQVAVRGEL
ncbi:MAG: flagellar basal body P-ring formation chaperone FlgA [Bryobacteraceae bacterium]|jgi:flagella basal body P-ring formation protein FlgA